MGGATIWPVPRAIDAEAHYYPRMWKRNLFFLYGGLFLIGIQVQRFSLMHRVSHFSSPNNRSFAYVVIDDAHGRVHGLGQLERPKARQVRLNQRSNLGQTASNPLNSYLRP